MRKRQITEACLSAVTLNPIGLYSRENKSKQNEMKNSNKPCLLTVHKPINLISFSFQSRPQEHI
jgi:hypothetical protein